MLGHADRQVLIRSRLNLAIQMGSAMFFHLELAKALASAVCPAGADLKLQRSSGSFRHQEPYGTPNLST